MIKMYSNEMKVLNNIEDEDKVSKVHWMHLVLDLIVFWFRIEDNRTARVG
jgi:hypothetical protein